MPVRGRGRVRVRVSARGALLLIGAGEEGGSRGGITHGLVAEEARWVEGPLLVRVQMGG